MFRAMDRRNYVRPKLVRQNEKWSKIEKDYEAKLEEKALLQERNRQNEFERAALHLAIEVEKEMKFGNKVRIIKTCPGCNSCKNESDCYVVEVPKHIQNKIDF